MHPDQTVANAFSQTFQPWAWGGPIKHSDVDAGRSSVDSCSGEEELEALFGRRKKQEARQPARGVPARIVDAHAASTTSSSRSSIDGTVFSSLLRRRIASGVPVAEQPATGLVALVGGLLFATDPRVSDQVPRYADRLVQPNAPRARYGTRRHPLAHARDVARADEPPSAAE